MSDFSHPFFAQSSFAAQGLNLQAVLDISALPDDVTEAMVEACDDLHHYRQIMLIGHGGRDLWSAVSAFVAEKVSDPIDSVTINTVERFFADRAEGMRFRLVYPGSSLVPLQRLGALLGWHNDSPFKVGVNQVWGSWFAYRALVLVDSQVPASKPLLSKSPCASCEAKPCIRACPAKAMDAGTFDLNRCVDFRKLADSPCRQRCLARLACPVGSDHRYSDDQLSYHYLNSMSLIERVEW